MKILTVVGLVSWLILAAPGGPVPPEPGPPVPGPFDICVIVPVLC